MLIAGCGIGSETHYVRAVDARGRELAEDRIRNINRLHRGMKIYFPEYQDAFGKLDGAFALEVLKKAPFPRNILELGAEGIRNIWHEAKLRGAVTAKPGILSGIGDMKKILYWIPMGDYG